MRSNVWLAVNAIGFAVNIPVFFVLLQAAPSGALVPLLSMAAFAVAIATQVVQEKTQK